MPDPKALSPDQIELLRGLPTGQAYAHGDNLRRPTDDQVPTILDMEPALACFDGEAAFRTEAADILLATIDAAVAAERERVLGVAFDFMADADQCEVFEALANRPSTTEDGGEQDAE